MSTETLIRRFYAELWETEDGASAAQILHPDLSFRGSLGLEKSGVAGFMEYRASVRMALTDYTCTIRELLVDGSKAAAQMFFEGRHVADFQGFAPTGKTVGWSGAAFFSAQDNLLKDIWVLGDIVALRKSLEANA